MPSTMWSLYCHQALGESPQDWGQGPASLPCLFMDVTYSPRTDLTTAGPRRGKLTATCSVCSVPSLPRTEPLGDSAASGQSRGRGSTGSDGPHRPRQPIHPRVSSQCLPR